MRPIYQLVHTLSYGDAISSEVLALERCFKESGRETGIFSIHTHPKLKGKAHHYSELPVETDSDLILHYSLGSPLNEVYKRTRAGTKSLIYHNLTPAKWFSSINPRVTADIESGIRELPELCKLSDRLISDSNFNALELKTLGFHADVLELPLDSEKWNVAVNPGIASMIGSNGGINILHVGRLAPNKCIEDIIKSFYFLHRYIAKESKLWLVGIDTDTELYSFGLKRLADALSISEAVTFAGCLDDSELKALYQGSSVYMCMSEHEGFCLPVIEAMHFGLPVIAYASSALPDTLGEGGILVDEKRHPELGELLYKVATDSSLRSQLIKAGHKRAAELSFNKFAERVKVAFGERPVQALSNLSNF